MFKISFSNLDSELELYKLFCVFCVFRGSKML